MGRFIIGKGGYYLEVIMEVLATFGEAWALILQPVVWDIWFVCPRAVHRRLSRSRCIAGLSLLLPFMFGMDPILGSALMIGMVAVVPTSDTFALF